jgi:DNA repair exonuclease
MSSEFSFLHFGDTHLGRNSPSRISKKRAESSVEAFEYVIEQAMERDVDFVVHAGDFFDSPNPWPSVIDSTQQKLDRLEEAGIPLIATRGNHDRSYGRGRTLKGITMDIYESELFHVVDPKKPEFPEFREPVDGVRVYAVGYHSDQTPRILDGFQPDAETFNVLLLHDFVEGLTRSYEGKHTSTDILSSLDLDYVAVGHDHDPQAPFRRQNGTVFAATGGTIDYTFNLADARKGYNIAHVEDGEVRELEQNDIPQTLALEKTQVDTADADPDTIRDEVKDKLRTDSAAVKVKITGEADPTEIPSQTIEERLEELEPVEMAEVLTSTTADVKAEIDRGGFDLLEVLDEHLPDGEKDEFRALQQKATGLMDTPANLTDSGNLDKSGREELRREAEEVLYED